LTDKPDGSLLYGIDIRGGAYNIEISGFEITGFDDIEDAGIFGRRGILLGNIAIHNNSIHDNYNGIDIGAASGLFPPGHSKLHISHNEIYMNLDTGIYLLRISDSTIDHNEICGNTVGISLRMASDLTIDHNEVLNNHRFGIRWADVDNTRLSHNKIEESGNDGVRIVGTNTGNTIEHNKVMCNTGSGIHLMDSTQNNALEYNHALGNGNGSSTRDIWCEPSVGPNTWEKNKYETATPLL